jgi:hypothetical protein
MIDYIKTVLTGQFEASLCMLDKCIRECPPEHWESKIANGTFRQVAYHTLFYGDLYLSPGLEAFEPTEVQRRGGLRPAGVATCVGLPKDDTLAYLAACRQKAVATLAAETPDSLQAPAGFPWLSLSRGELHWYNIRHIQHHNGPAECIPAKGHRQLRRLVGRFGLAITAREDGRRPRRSR